jgi:hypothetical protein
MGLITSQSQHVTEAQALPRIGVFLFNQPATEVVKQERERMEAKAKIEYLEEVANGEAAFKAKIEAQANTKARQSEQAAQKSKVDEKCSWKEKP